MIVWIIQWGLMQVSALRSGLDGFHDLKLRATLRNPEAGAKPRLRYEEQEEWCEKRDEMRKTIRMTVLSCECARTFRLLDGGQPTGRDEQHSTAKHYSSKETIL